MARRAVATSLPIKKADALLGGRSPNDQLTQRLRAFAPNASVFVLDDGRILTMRSGLAFVFASRGAFEDHLAALAPKHPRIEDTFPQGDGFIDAVPALIGQLPKRLGLRAKTLTGMPDSLSAVDRALQRRGKSASVNDPALMASLVAYAGEVTRAVAGGDWEIRTTSASSWEAVIVAGAHVYRTSWVYKALLEGMDLEATFGTWPDRPIASTGMFANQQPRIAAAIGALGAVSASEYEITKRYSDGRPWVIRFRLDRDVGGFPIKAGTAAVFSRSGGVISAVLSRRHPFKELVLEAGAKPTYYRSQRDGYVNEVILGDDQTIDGLLCRGGTLVLLDPKHHLRAATLSVAQRVDGVLCAAGFVELERGHLRRATLAEDSTIDGQRVVHGKLVTLDKKGAVVSVD